MESKDIKVLASLGYYVSFHVRDAHTVTVTKLQGDTLLDHCEDIIRKRMGFIPAIRHYRIVTGLGLFEAKAAVTKMALDRGLAVEKSDGFHSITLRPEFGCGGSFGPSVSLD